MASYTYSPVNGKRKNMETNVYGTWKFIPSKATKLWKMEENGPIDLLGFTPEEDAKNYALVESLVQHDDLEL